MIDILHMVTMITYHLIIVEAPGFKMLNILQVVVFSSMCYSVASDCDIILIKDVMTLYIQGGCTLC